MILFQPQNQSQIQRASLKKGIIRRHNKTGQLKGHDNKNGRKSRKKLGKIKNKRKTESTVSAW
jgi:hypothetical protein